MVDPEQATAGARWVVRGPGIYWRTTVLKRMFYDGRNIRCVDVNPDGSNGAFTLKFHRDGAVTLGLDEVSVCAD